MSTRAPRIEGLDDPEETRELSAGAALLAVDQGLSGIGARELLTSKEAASLVQEIRGVIRAPHAGALLDALRTECEADTIISTARLADALLDVRLAFTAEVRQDTVADCVTVSSSTA